MRLFTERGYDSTSIADIAQVAHLSSMTVFRYFSAKGNLRRERRVQRVHR